VKQQVNLYQPIFRKQRIVFSAQTMLGVGLGFLVLLVAYGALVEWQVAGLERELRNQLGVEERAVGQLTRLRESLPPSEPSREMLDRVESLEQRRARLRESVSQLRTRIPAEPARLRPRLEALARRHPEGIWLTRIEMSDAGKMLGLSGRALSADLVPAYIERLADEPVMEGLAFRQVRIRSGDEGNPGVAFTISTDPGDDE